MLNALIFDLDMTLLNSLEGCLRGANLFAERFGLPLKTEADILAVASLTTKEFWEQLFGVFNKEQQEFFKSQVVPAITRHTTLFPEGDEILQSAKNKGYLLAVATNRSNPWHDLAKLNLAKYFDTAVGASDVPRPKPEPDMLLAILRQLGVEAHTAIYIGDSTADMHCAKRADIKVVGLTQSGATPDELFQAGASVVRPTLADSRDVIDC
jgi:HAD superfamily hydrolase (TIGR01549 family)